MQPLLRGQISNNMIQSLSIHLPSGHVMLVDIEDIPKIFNYSWHIFYNRNHVYVRGWHRETRKKIFLHRFILDVRPGDKIHIDHINGNTLDNRKSNLRICTPLENSRNTKLYKSNTSGFKGVYWCKAANNWMAYITVNKKRINLGLFVSKIEAAKAYNDAAIKYFGSFARINDI